MESPLAQKWNRLIDPNHLDHEEIIRYLQDHPDSGSVPYLKEAILLKPALEYLEYDDYGAYYKKCLWALQEIGTPEAVRLIRECAVSDIPELKGEAIYRLSKPPLSERL
jgi:hypothetical protein